MAPEETEAESGAPGIRFRGSLLLLFARVRGECRVGADGSFLRLALPLSRLSMLSYDAVLTISLGRVGGGALLPSLVMDMSELC